MQALQPASQLKNFLLAAELEFRCLHLLVGVGADYRDDALDFFLAVLLTNQIVDIVRESNGPVLLVGTPLVLRKVCWPDTLDDGQYADAIPTVAVEDGEIATTDYAQTRRLRGTLRHRVDLIACRAGRHRMKAHDDAAFERSRDSAAYRGYFSEGIYAYVMPIVRGERRSSKDSRKDGVASSNMI